MKLMDRNHFHFIIATLTLCNSCKHKTSEFPEKPLGPTFDVCELAQQAAHPAADRKD